MTAMHPQPKRFAALAAACLLGGSNLHLTAAFVAPALHSNTVASPATAAAAVASSSSQSVCTAAARGGNVLDNNKRTYVSCIYRIADVRRSSSSLRMTSNTSGVEKLKIGLFGGGTVGGGYYDICENDRKDFFKGQGCDLDIVKICVRDASKPRDFKMSPHTTVTDKYDDILEDDSINCIVELIGGVTDAKDIVFKAIKKNKHVITANKALLAKHLPEIEQLLEQHPTVKFGYEAAVCGGIPIIHTLQNDYVGDRIKKICGIMNGTTNFMLSKMESEGANYDDVLKEAQALGFAEADPTADVEGYDVQAKIALLAKLAYGVTVPPESVPCEGISKLTAVDFEFAKMMGCTIKLLGTAMTEDGALSVFVSPVVVPLDDPIASIRGPGNIVSITSKNLGVSSYSGPGAGRFPTANSVASDTMRIGINQVPRAFPFSSDMKIEPNFKANFYTRIKCKDALGIIQRVGELAAVNKVSILAIHQNPIKDRNNVDFVVTTDPCQLSQISAFCDSIEKEKWAIARPLCMSMLSA